MAETDETFSAKQIANRIGTDAKTFRKWLRSPNSPYKAVGQGQRYEFPKSDLRKIDKQFHAWKDRPSKPVNGKPRQEPKESQKISLEIDGRGQTTANFREKVEVLSKARDEEYGTVDGEELDENDERWIDASPAFHGEPTEKELDELEDLDLGELDDLD